MGAPRQGMGLGKQAAQPGKHSMDQAMDLGRGVALRLRVLPALCVTIAPGFASPWLLPSAFERGDDCDRLLRNGQAYLETAVSL